MLSCREWFAAFSKEPDMERIEQQEDLIDLGSVSGETKGPPDGNQPDVAGPKFTLTGGLSND